MKRAATITLLLIQVLAALISVSVFFVEESERFEADANTLIATFGVGMAIFGVALTLSASKGDRSAWRVLWYWPLFFILHVIALKSYVPDLVFAVLTAGALIVLHPLAGGGASLSQTD